MPPRGSKKAENAEPTSFVLDVSDVLMLYYWATIARSGDSSSRSDILRELIEASEAVPVPTSRTRSRVKFTTSMGLQERHKDLVERWQTELGTGSRSEAIRHMIKTLAAQAAGLPHHEWRRGKGVPRATDSQAAAAGD